MRLVTADGTNSAKVVKVDAGNDLALLKTEGKVAALPVVSSRGVKLGGTVATVGLVGGGFLALVARPLSHKLCRSHLLSVAVVRLSRADDGGGNWPGHKQGDSTTSIKRQDFSGGTGKSCVSS